MLALVPSLPDLSPTTHHTLYLSTLAVHLREKDQLAAGLDNLKLDLRATRELAAFGQQVEELSAFQLANPLLVHLRSGNWIAPTRGNPGA